MGAGKILKNYAKQLLVQNLWNFASEQRSGMTFVLSTRTHKKVVVRPPGVSSNTNPYLASFLTGVMVRERHKEGIKRVVGVLETSLAAQGDDFYWRILRPTALLAGMFLVLIGEPLLGVALFLLGFNVFAQGERLLGYARGLKKGRKGLREVLLSMARTKKILLPFAGGIVGLISAIMIFSIEESGALFSSGWFVYIPLFLISIVFALFRISPLINLLTNIVLVIILGMFI